MDRYSPKPGDVIADWKDPVGPYMCTESGPTEGGKSSAGSGEGNPDKHPRVNPGNADTGGTMGESGTPNGDNPGYSFNVSLPSQGDQRNKGTSGSGIFPGLPGMPH